MAGTYSTGLDDSPVGQCMVLPAVRQPLGLTRRRESAHSPLPAVNRPMFDREYEIVRLVARHAAKLWPDIKGERVLQAERGYGRGVADLMVLDIDRVNFADRRERKLPPARRSGEAAVLQAVITHAGASIDEVAAVVPMTRSHVRHLLRQLERARLISTADGAVRPTWTTAPVLSRAIAIEAKLADWRSAAIQADRYQDFADETYIAMPAGRIASLMERPERLEGLGLGLIAVSLDACDIVVPAVAAPPRLPALRRWVEEVEYGELIGEARQLIQPFPARFAQPSPAELVAI